MLNQKHTCKTVSKRWILSCLQLTTLSKHRGYTKLREFKSQTWTSSAISTASWACRPLCYLPVTSIQWRLYAEIVECISCQVGNQHLHIFCRQSPGWTVVSHWRAKQPIRVFVAITRLVLNLIQQEQRSFNYPTPSKPADLDPCFTGSYKAWRRFQSRQDCSANEQTMHINRQNASTTRHAV